MVSLGIVQETGTRESSHIIRFKELSRSSFQKAPQMELLEMFKDRIPSSVPSSPNQVPHSLAFQVGPSLSSPCSCEPARFGSSNGDGLGSE